MIDRMDRNLIYGVTNAKPYPPGATRAWQRDRLVELGCTCVREGIDFANTWLGPNRYNWNVVNPEVGIGYKDAVQMSVDAGLEVIGLIATTPSWALPEAAPESGENHKWPPAEEHTQAFIDACVACATEFNGLIRYWEFWNEENAHGWHSDDPAEYTKWLIRMSDAVKSVNSNALVSVGGFDVAQDDDYLQGIRDAGGQSKYDAVSIHPYGDYRSDLPWDTDPSGTNRTIQGTRDNMVANNDGAKSIWITEYDWRIGNVDEATQALRLEAALREMRNESRNYVTVATWLALTDVITPDPEDNDIKGGLINSNLSKRPAFSKFKDIATSGSQATQNVPTRAPVIQRV